MHSQTTTLNKTSIGAYLQLLRPRQWVKNGFIFIGIIFGNTYFNAHTLVQVILATLSFSLLASSIYILNDICDEQHDRLHPTKCKRPIASHKISTHHASLLMLALMSIALFIGWFISTTVLQCLLAYLLLNIGYNFVWKNIVIVDVFIIAAGYLLRILVGTIGVGIPPSSWLLVCSLMLSLLLGFCKRYSELKNNNENIFSTRTVLKDYNENFLNVLIGICAACAIISYSFYVLYNHFFLPAQAPLLIYTIPLVFFGISRYLYLVYCKNSGDDPSLTITTDLQIIFTVCLWLLMSIYH